MASNSRQNALHLVSRGWKRLEKNARGDQRPSSAAWSDASTTSDKAAPSLGWLNNVAFTSASFTSMKALTASSGSLSFLCVPCEDVNFSSGASSVAARGMKRL
ncbi:hypothetical protein T11_3128 [Trichinella zimbabwensis]|uniref:Uncharacterized protein n=1 Tax=Trichinella zimbabwensis TaxID=268475 RepID=A0A0V1H2A1_9BILA|nr:hypothetical protein T11_3128 [Trichinella zimbabwensis]